jgi:hypothetical protein
MEERAPNTPIFCAKPQNTILKPLPFSFTTQSGLHLLITAFIALNFEGILELSLDKRSFYLHF